jgi:hypothetical protein
MELIRMWVQALGNFMSGEKSPLLDELKKHYPNDEKGVKP